MSQILIFILGIIVGGGLIWYFIKNKSDEVAQTENFNEKQLREKERRKQKIMKGMEAQKSITNDAVQDLLGVSDATATRYLDELEKEGKIRQVGKRGGYVYYEKQS
ncbi:MAG: DeoR family transcriptional regulator [bacterium]